MIVFNSSKECKDYWKLKDKEWKKVFKNLELWKGESPSFDRIAWKFEIGLQEESRSWIPDEINNNLPMEAPCDQVAPEKKANWEDTKQSNQEVEKTDEETDLFVFGKYNQNNKNTPSNILGNLEKVHIGNKNYVEDSDMGGDINFSPSIRVMDSEAHQHSGPKDLINFVMGPNGEINGESLIYYGPNEEYPTEENPDEINISIDLNKSIHDNDESVSYSNRRRMAKPTGFGRQITKDRCWVSMHNRRIDKYWEAIRISSQSSKVDSSQSIVEESVEVLNEVNHETNHLEHANVNTDEAAINAEVSHTLEIGTLVGFELHGKEDLIKEALLADDVNNVYSRIYSKHKQLKMTKTFDFNTPGIGIEILHWDEKRKYSENLGNTKSCKALFISLHPRPHKVGLHWFDSECSWKVVRAYASNKPWLIGFLMDIFGALLMLRALSLAPVSVIQPVSGCGLAILSVFSHFYLKEVMNVVDWIGITLAGLGTIGIGAGGEEQKTSSISILHLPWLACGVAILFVLLNGWLRIYRRQRREQELMQSEVIEEIIYGLESGILFGIASVISKMGFLFLEQGFSALLVPICISISICCSASGFVYQTRGLKHGRAVVVSTCAAVASIVTGVLAGMLALGERLPESTTSRSWLLLGW
ncbi:hypothetical protein R6Q57_016628 [Mikania cordata]